MATLSILHLEDNPADHELVVHTLARSEWVCEVVLVDTLEDFETALERPQPFDVVLADYHLGGFTGLDAWRLSSRISRATSVLVARGTWRSPRPVTTYTSFSSAPNPTPSREMSLPTMMWVASTTSTFSIVQNGKARAPPVSGR